MKRKAPAANINEAPASTVHWWRSLEFPVGTPALCFSSSVIAQNGERFARLAKEAFGDQLAGLFFPCKVAPHRKIVAAVARNLEYGFEVIQEREFAHVAEVGSRPLLISGNMKSEQLVRRSIASDRAKVVCESVAELDLVNRMGAEMDRRVEIFLRIKMTPRRRLGIPVDTIPDVVRYIRTKPNLSLLGLHMHPGTNLCDERAAQSLGVLIDAAERCAGLYRLIAINLGSGLPTFSDPLSNLEKRLLSYAERLRQCDYQIVLEPGRPLVGDAAVLISDIVEVRPDERQLTINTASYVVSNPCAATAEYYVRRRIDGSIVPLQAAAAGEGWRVGGIWPAEGDSTWVENPGELEPGDQLIFAQAGAYTLGFLHELAFGGIEPFFQE